MNNNEYSITGDVTYNYGVLVVNERDSSMPRKIAEFDVSTDIWSNYTNAIEKTELHFTAYGGLADDANILKPGDNVNIRFSIKGFLAKNKERERILFNKLVVRSMRIVKDYEFDIKRWREQQRKEMNDELQNNK